MEKTQHCVVCEHKKVDFTTGSYCGITDKKPKFLEKCRDIKLGEILEQRLSEVNVDLEKIKNKKAGVLTNVITFTSLSAGVFIAGILLWQFIWDSGYIATLPIIVMGTGFIGIPKYLGPLFKFKNELGAAQSKKDDLDKLLDLYGVTYKLDIELKKGPHDTIDVDKKLFVDYNKRD
jgi:hypothetical protein